ncbi:dehydratase, partial [Streptomyces sp. 16-176A]
MAEPRIFTSVDELKAAVGEQLGHTDWLEIDQKRIDLFAEAT